MGSREATPIINKKILFILVIINNRMQKYNILRNYLNFSRKSLAVSKKRLTFAPAIRKKSTCFSSSVG
jgi:hypothetical protein